MAERSKKNTKYWVIFGFFLGITFAFMAARYLNSEKNKIDKTEAQNQIENLTTANFASSNISQWTNDAGFLSQVDYAQLKNGSNLFMDYRPNNAQCSNNQILKYDLLNKRWVCGNEGSGTTSSAWGAISGTLTDQADLKNALDSKLSISSSLGGDVSGTLANVLIDDDSHQHTGSTISGLSPSDFTSTNISQWTNDSNFISGVNFSQITNSTGVYLDYKPDNTACTQGQVLKYDAALSRWLCGVDSGAGAVAWGDISGNITDQSDLNTALTNKLGTTASFGGDVTGNYDSIVVSNDSHDHTGATISGLTTADFTSQNISQWTNDSNFISDDTSVPKNNLTNSGALSFTWSTAELASQVIVEGENISLLNNNAGYITSVNNAQIANGTGVYWNYKPNDDACSQDQVLKYDAGLSHWVCANDTSGGASNWGSITGTLGNQTDLNTALTGKINILDNFGGDVSGTYNSLSVTNDSHDHTGATISGLSPADFTSQNISQWTNDSNFISGVNFSQVANGGGVYLNYKPNDVACDHDQVLKYDAALTRWVCGTDNGGGTVTWGSISGTLTDQGDLSTALSGKLSATANYGGDVSGTYDNLAVANDSHSHTGATISGLSASNFTSANISQWTNDANFISGIDISQIANGADKYFNYKPNDVACTEGQVMKYDATNARWICGNDNNDGVGGGSGGGVIASVTTVQTRTQSTYTTTISGDGPEITPLNIVMTPKKAGNKIILEWIVNGEVDNNTVFLVTRNGTLLPSSDDGTNAWSGTAVASYDNENNSTPGNITVKIIDNNSLAIETTYALHVRSSDNRYTQPFALNGSLGSTGENYFETTLSVGTATEIDPSPTAASGEVTVGSMTGTSVFADSTADDDWIGLGTGAGLMEFDDQAIDEVNFLNARVGIGTSTPVHTLDVNGNIGLAIAGYLNFGNTDGNSGYGIRDNGGMIEYKDDSGNWIALNSLTSGGGGSGSETAISLIDSVAMLSQQTIGSSYTDVNDLTMTKTLISGHTYRWVFKGNGAVQNPAANIWVEITDGAGTKLHENLISTISAYYMTPLYFEYTENGTGASVTRKIQVRLETGSMIIANDEQYTGTLELYDMSTPVGGSSGQAINFQQASGTTDIDTTNASFEDMPEMSVTLTTAGNPVEINFSAGVGTSGAMPTFRLLVDGTPIGAADATSDRSNVALTWLATLSAGSHTIKAQWRSSGGVIYNRPTLELEHRILTVKEFLGGSGSATATTVGSMTGTSLFADATADDDWLGLGLGAGLIEFDDQATDEINFLNAKVGIGTSTPNHVLDVNGNLGVATSGYINFSATDGSTGYGFRDNAGIMEFKDSTGSWVALSSLTGGGGGGGGVVASVTTVQTRTQDSFTATSSGNGSVITPLNIVFTPKKAGNKVVLEWVVNGEGAYDVVFNVTRNGVLLANSNDGTNIWSGINAVSYDVDNASTPVNNVVRIVDENSLDVESTYSILVRSSNVGVPLTYNLNRTTNSTGANQYEALMSTGVATEIDPSPTGGSGEVTMGSMTGTTLFADTTADDDWIGLGVGAGVIEFDNQAIDEINFLDARVGIGTGTPVHTLDVNGNIGLAASGFINFGATDGDSGYGFRDNAGVMEYKDNSGNWIAFNTLTGGGAGPGSGNGLVIEKTLPGDQSVNGIADLTDLTITTTLISGHTYRWVFQGNGVKSSTGTPTIYLTDENDNVITSQSTSVSNGYAAQVYLLNTEIGSDTQVTRKIRADGGGGTFNYLTTSGYYSKFYLEDVTNSSNVSTSVGSMTGASVFADGSADEDWLGLGATAGRIQFDNQVTDSILLMDANIGIGQATPTHTLDVNGNIGLAASGYINFGVTDGTDGYGIRDNSGNIELKNDSGDWKPIASKAGYILLQHRLPSGTDGGGATANQWTTLDINTELTDTSDSCTLASSQFTLAAGTYEVDINSNFYNTRTTTIRLRNVSDSTTTLLGTSTYAGGSGGLPNIKGRFTIASEKTFEVQYFVELGQATYGLGVNMKERSGGFDEVEVYRTVELHKIE